MRIQLDHGAQHLPEAERVKSQQARAAEDTAKASNTSEVGQDQARFSGAHAQVQALAAQAAQLPEVRMERVQALRQALLGGGYQRTPHEVAGALIEHLTAEPAA